MRFVVLVLATYRSDLCCLLNSIIIHMDEYLMLETQDFVVLRLHLSSKEAVEVAAWRFPPPVDHQYDAYVVIVWVRSDR